MLRSATSGMGSCNADSAEPFALSKLSAVSGARQALDDAARPQCSSSTGGVAWTIVEPRATSVLASGTSVCGRSRGMVQHARCSQGAARPVADVESGSATLGVDSGGAAVKLSSQALLRRLLRKKPTVRQILGKDPVPPPPRHTCSVRRPCMHARLSFQQSCGPISAIATVPLLSIFLSANMCR